jgi:hypothetical protein
MVSLHLRLPKIVLKMSLHAGGERLLVLRFNNMLQIVEDTVSIQEIQRAEKRHWYLAKKGIVISDRTYTYWLPNNGIVVQDYNDIFAVVLEGRKICLGNNEKQGDETKND